MPHPIPDWDLARRLVKYVGTRQIEGMDTTIREVSVFLGIGRDRIENLMQEKNIIYRMITGDKEGGRDLLVLENVPQTLALDSDLSVRDIDRSFQGIVSGNREVRIVRHKKIKKKEREKMKIVDFWSRGKQEGE
jgi:hypothetical protein